MSSQLFSPNCGDWLAFAASIVGSIAWPGVALVLVLILRNQIKALAARLLKITLPGGFEASFAQELEKSREDVDALDADGEAPLAAQPLLPEDDGFLDLAQRFPEAAVLESFKQVEREVAKLRWRTSGAKTTTETMRALVSNGIVSRSAGNLFESLRHLRNRAAHGSTGGGISPAQALDFADQAKTLVIVLQKKAGVDE